MPTPDHLSLQRQYIQQLPLERFIVHLDISGPLDARASLGKHFELALGAEANFPQRLRDEHLLADVQARLETDVAGHYIQRVVNPPGGAPLAVAERAFFFGILASKVLEHDAPGWLAGQMALPLADGPYRAASLAQVLWEGGTCQSRCDAFYAAVFLLYETLFTQPTPASWRAPAPEQLALGGYLHLNDVTEHLLAEPERGNAVEQVFALWGAEVFYLASAQWRAPTSRERLAGMPTDAHGKVFIRGTAVQHPGTEILEALLDGPGFQRWQRRVVEAVQWYGADEANPVNRALAEQALLDTLSPPDSRRPGYLLDYELFTLHNTDTSLRDIRIDLCNSVQGSLGCTLALAELACALLMRHLAPELLIEDAGPGFRYEPNVYWANLRHGARLLLAEGQPLTLHAAEQAPARVAHAELDGTRQPGRLDLLGDIYVEWAALNGVLDANGPYSDHALSYAYWRYELAWAFERLELPDRVAKARENLKRAGLDPDGRDVDGHPYLEAYLDGDAHRLPKSQRPHLANVNAWFDTHFDAYTQSAHALYEGVWQRCLEQLPADHAERLATLPWVAYAISWPRYIGPIQGGTPSFGDSDPHHWCYENACEGFVIHQRGAQHDWLYEVFPMRWQWRVTVVETEQERGQLDDPHNNLPHLLALGFEDYNGHAIPWHMADFARSTAVLASAGAQPLHTLAEHYARTVAMSRIESLRNVCKAATAQEIARQARLHESVWHYLWRLIKRTVPLASCVDAKDGSDTATCVADALPLFGLGLRTGSRVLRPLIKWRHKQALQAHHSYQLAQDALRTWSIRNATPLRPPVRIAGLAPRRWRSEPAVGRPGQGIVMSQVDGSLQPVARQPMGQWRLIDEASGAPFGPHLEPIPEAGMGLFTTRSHPAPGQNPAALTAPAGPTVLPDSAEAIAYERAPDRVEVSIDGEPYRLARGPRANVLLHTRHAPLAGTGSGPIAPQPTTVAARPGQPMFMLAPPPASQGANPSLGEVISRAVMTQMIEPAQIRFRPHDVSDGQIAAVFVRDNKVFKHSQAMLPGKPGRPGKPAGRSDTVAMDRDQARLSLGVTSPPVYHRRILAEPYSDAGFGLPAGVPPEWVASVNLRCPVLRLGGLAESIPDRRTLRGIVLQWRAEGWLMVEADLGVFYGTRWPLPSAQRVPFRLERLRDLEAIEHYLEVSETYRIVATHSNLQADVDNLTGLLRDWLGYRQRFEPASPSAYAEFLSSAEQQLLPMYARNILTRRDAQDNLAQFTPRGVPGLNQEIIPDWGHVTHLAQDRQLHIVGVLNNLLPASGNARTPYYPMRVELLDSPLIAQTLRKHLRGANLAFALVTLRDGQRRVYFSLSGGKAHRNIGLQPPTASDQAPIEYIDARARMDGQLPDPRFTDLPATRRVNDLDPRMHSRHLDSERLIATVANQDLLAEHQQVARIEVFTLFNACRSCGGFVLPRLRLDYPTAQFSVSYLLDYPS